MTKDQWIKRRNAWVSAMYLAAVAIGKDKPLYRILGSLAWGRFDGEQSPGEHLDHVAYGAGFLAGARFVALNAGREFNLDGTREMERIHDRIQAEVHK